MLSSIRTFYGGAAAILRSWAANEVVRPLLEPILHPSRWRIRALGLSTALGHPLFYWLWGHVFPQPYEKLWQRLAMSALGLALLVFPSLTASPPRRAAAATFSIIFWITLPVFFFWMYLCNDRNPVWLASVGAMFLIYYHLTDWRLATLGSATGVLAAWLLFEAFGPPTAALARDELATHAIVIGFSWTMGLVLGISSFNLRREQLNYTLGTMAIMAHELRTPLATMALLGDALRNEAAALDGERAAGLERLAAKVSHLVRNMNRQIDMQITNARLLRLPGQTERVSAAEVVRQALEHHPFRNARERDCVVVRVYADFAFLGSHALFTQVIDNLVKNALRSLAASTSAPAPGDLLLEVGSSEGRGRIVVSDRGVGMTDDLRARLFQPFVSTDRGTGHGLGLAFCQRVVHGAHGTIRVKTAHLQGASFTIELPLAP